MNKKDARTSALRKTFATINAAVLMFTMVAVSFPAAVIAQDAPAAPASVETPSEPVAPTPPADPAAPTDPSAPAAPSAPTAPDAPKAPWYVGLWPAGDDFPSLSEFPPVPEDENEGDTVETAFFFNPGLTVNKTVAGSSTSPSEFSFEVRKLTLNGYSTQTYQFQSDGSNDVSLGFLGSLGFFSIVEVENNSDDFVASYSNCNAFLMTPFTSHTCTITNTYVAPTVCSIVSNQDTLIEGEFSIPTWEHEAWSDQLDADGAQWIWSEAQVSNPGSITDVEFTRTFTLTAPLKPATLQIAADNEYEVEINGDPVTCVENGGETYAVTDTCTIPASDLQVGVNTITFKVKNTLLPDGYTPVDYQHNPAGLYYKLDVMNGDCDATDLPEIEKPATIVATKIMCENESDLPNWGAGGADVTASTVSDFLASHPTCHTQEGWNFEWSPDGAGNPGDQTGAAGGAWTPFGPTNASGKATVEVAPNTKVWVREQMNSNYIDYTGQNTDQPTSAEFYCSTDVLNYDNWEFIDTTENTTFHCVAFNTLKRSDVTMCKDDVQGTGLAGWTLMLKGDHIGSTDVRPDGNAYKIENVPAGDYIVTAIGDYVYRAQAGAEYSDAAFSKRAVGDSVYGGTYAPWTRVNDFPVPNTGWLGVMLNGAVTDWGTVFNPAHEYVHETSTIAQSDFSFRILDDQYSDNSGKIEVNLDEGYAGVTGNDGCVVIEDVPYGTYTAAELMKEGWENVSGLISVVVDAPTETHTVVNQDTTIVPVNTAKVIATKVVCDTEADLPNLSGDGAITATTASDWVAAHPDTCRLQNDWSFEWGNAGAGNGGPTTIGHAPNYTTFGPTVNGVAVIDIPVAGLGGRIEMREVLQAGYIPFTDNVANDVSAEFFCANDAAGYDNWEWINNPVAGDTYHCVAFNAPTVPPQEPGTPTENTLVVTAANMQGWVEGVYDAVTALSTTGNSSMTTSGTFGEFVTGPGTAPLGAGSFQEDIAANGGDGQRMMTSAYNGVDLADIKELAYTTYVQTNVSGQATYLRLYIDLDGNGSTDDVLFFEPVYQTGTYGMVAGAGAIPNQGTVTNGTWQTWDADAGGWWTSNDGFGGPPLDTLAHYLTRPGNENAKIATDQHGVRLTAGSGAGAWDNFLGNFDKFVIRVDNGTTNAKTTYDFEPETVTNSSETVTITGNTSAGENLLGWMFGRDGNTETPFAFVLGNQSIGTGSLDIDPITNTVDGNSDKFVAELFLQKALADIQSISYDFKIDAPDATVEEQFYMNVYVNFPVSGPTKFYDCRYNVVPVTGSTGSYTTVTFNPASTYSVTTRTGGEASPFPCPASPAAMGAGAIVRAVSLNVGDSTASDTGVGGFFDKVVTAIKTGSNIHTTTYDFEMTPAPTVTTGGNGGGNGGGGNGSNNNDDDGRVLGATTDAACTMLINTFMGLGRPNDPGEVGLLQDFLNQELGTTLPINGVFGAMTDAAVHSFQKKYWQEILQPWFGIAGSGIADQDDSTGYVFKTTQRMVNNIHCPELDLPMPQLP